MSSSSITTSDGEVLVTTDDTAAIAATPGPDGGAPVVRHPGHANFTFGVHSHRPFDGASFIVGLLVGMLVLLLLQRGRRRAERRDARGTARAAAIGPQPARDDDRMAAAVAALARRTATLETIVTDPAQRTARDIDALR